jgi:hypothetical protein
LKKLFTVSLAVIFFASACLVGQAKTNPNSRSRKPFDCIKCGMQAGCRTCTAGGTALFCNNPDCSNCFSNTHCWNPNSVQQPSVTGERPSSPAPESASTPPEEASAPLKTLTLKGSLIKEIGAQHPRFAATLANGNLYGFHPGEYEFYWTPIEISPRDIDAFLNRKKYEAFFRKYNQRARRINEQIQRGEISEIVYKLTVKQVDASRWEIEILVTQPGTVSANEYAISSLDIKLTYAGSSIETKDLIDSTWQLGTRKPE